MLIILLAVMTTGIFLPMMKCVIFAIMYVANEKIYGENIGWLIRTVMDSRLFFTIVRVVGRKKKVKKSLSVFMDIVKTYIRGGMGLKMTGSKFVLFVCLNKNHMKEYKMEID